MTPNEIFGAYVVGAMVFITIAFVVTKCYIHHQELEAARAKLEREEAFKEAIQTQQKTMFELEVRSEVAKPVVEPYYKKSKPVVTNSTPVRTAPVSRSHNTHSSSSSTTPTSSRSSYYDSGSSYGYGGSDGGSCSGGGDSGGSSGGCD